MKKILIVMMALWGYNSAYGQTTTTTTTTTTTVPVGNVVYGDTNCDGKVELADAILIMQAISNPDKFGVNGTEKGHLTAKGRENADCSGSGDGMTVNDALAIQNYLLNIIPSLPEK